MRLASQKTSDGDAYQQMRAQAGWGEELRIERKGALVVLLWEVPEDLLACGILCKAVSRSKGLELLVFAIRLCLRSGMLRSKASALGHYLRDLGRACQNTCGQLRLVSWSCNCCLPSVVGAAIYRRLSC